MELFLFMRLALFCRLILFLAHTKGVATHKESMISRGLAAAYDGGIRTW
jgi:hypothetical protein